MGKDGCGDDEAAADAARWGLELDPADLPTAAGDEVWSVNAPALRAFRAVDTQWRGGGMGPPLGLDYSGVRAGLELAGIEMTPALWAALGALGITCGGGQ